MRPLIAGNWKMNGTLGDAEALLHGILEGLGDLPRRVDLLVCPPFTTLAATSDILRAARSPIHVGGQNLHWEARGAYTGEISAAMLVDAGARYVLVGHSERRTYFAETGDTLLRKVRAAMRGNLTPILCIGESLEDRGGRPDGVRLVAPAGGDPAAALRGGVRRRRAGLRAGLGDRHRADGHPRTGGRSPRADSSPDRRGAWRDAEPERPGFSMGGA